MKLGKRSCNSSPCDSPVPAQRGQVCGGEATRIWPLPPHTRHDGTWLEPFALEVAQGTSFFLTGFIETSVQRRCQCERPLISLSVRIPDRSVRLRRYRGCFCRESWEKFTVQFKLNDFVFHLAYLLQLLLFSRRLGQGTL